MNPYASQSGAQNLGLSGNQYGGSNPYLQQNIDKSMGDITRQYNNTVAPQRAGAMARSGSFGNSGQQQMQLEDQRNLGETLANTSNQMRMQDYTQQQGMYRQDQQDNIARRGQDRQYDLGLRGNDLGFANLDANINNSNFSNQLAGANFGLNAYNTLQNGNNLGLQAGTQIQNAQLDYQNQYTSGVNAMAGGRGQATQVQAQQSSPLMGALGGYQLYNAYQQAQPQPMAAPPIFDGGYGIGQGSAYGGNRAGL